MNSDNSNHNIIPNSARQMNETIKYESQIVPNSARQISKKIVENEDFEELNIKNEKLESNIKITSLNFFYEKYIVNFISEIEISETNIQLDFLVNYYSLLKYEKCQIPKIPPNTFSPFKTIKKYSITKKGIKFRNYIWDNEIENRFLENYNIFLKNENFLKFKINKNWIFIGISYGDELITREKNIKEAIEETNFIPQLVKEKLPSSNSTIDEKMIELINKSKYGIFDFSFVFDNKSKNIYPNIGAVIEAGIMLGLNRDILIICNEKDKDNIHFDIRNRPILFFNSDDDLKEKLKNRIKELWSRN